MTSEVMKAALDAANAFLGWRPDMAILSDIHRRDRDRLARAFEEFADQITAQSGEGRSGAGADAVAEEAARSAMRNAEVARTDIVKPVNGSAPYTVVMFHGQHVEFHDGEWTIDMHRDAGTGKAAAYAQAINSALFDLAKNAALAGLNARQSGDDAREKFLTAYVSEDCKIIGIEHDTDADWHKVHDAHIALWNRLEDRIREREKCPRKPAFRATDDAGGVE